MVRKTTVWILQTMNWRDCTREDVDMAEKEKPESILIAAQIIHFRININGPDDNVIRNRGVWLSP